MIITITDVHQEFTKNGAEYQKVSGVDGDGKQTTKMVFDNLKDKWSLLEENKTLEFKMVKKGQFWNVADILEVETPPPQTSQEVLPEHQEVIDKAREEARQEAPPPNPQAVGMATKEIGDMIRAKYLHSIFGDEAHFENRIFDIYRPKTILQPFGGRADYGLRLDVKRVVQNEAIEPDVIGDAHCLPFGDAVFDFVLCDPPYSTEESAKLFGTGMISTKLYVAEAVRVTRIGGHVALYHRRMSARPKGTRYDRIIVVLTRVNHSPRVCCIFQKVQNLFEWGNKVESDIEL